MDNPLEKVVDLYCSIPDTAAGSTGPRQRFCFGLSDGTCVYFDPRTDIVSMPLTEFRESVFATIVQASALVAVCKNHDVCVTCHRDAGGPDRWNVYPKSHVQDVLRLPIIAYADVLRQVLGQNA